MWTLTATPHGGSILLIDGAAYQDVYLSCEATLDSNCDYAGLVFGYVDKDNFWVRLYDDPNDLVRVYQVSDGTWTQKNGDSFTITTGSAFDMTAEVRAGAAHDYGGTVPGGPALDTWRPPRADRSLCDRAAMPRAASQGQVGILSSEGSDNSFDDFKVPLDTPCAAWRHRTRSVRRALLGTSRQGFRWTGGTSARAASAASTTPTTTS